MGVRDCESIIVILGFELGEVGGVLALDEFDDFHGGVEETGGGSIGGAEKLSESVACELWLRSLSSSMMRSARSCRAARRVRAKVGWLRVQRWTVLL